MRVESFKRGIVDSFVLAVSLFPFVGGEAHLVRIEDKHSRHIIPTLLQATRA